MSTPDTGVRALAVALLLLIAYGGAAALLMRRAGLRPRAVEAIGVGAALAVVAVATIAVVARVGAELEDRTPLPLDVVSLEAAAVVLVLLPLLVLVAARRALPARANARRVALWALPALALALAASVAVLAFGVDTRFTSDADHRGDVVKELVASNSLLASGDSPLIEPANARYPGFLAARAAVTRLAGEDTGRPSAAWVLLVTAAMACGVAALALNLGLSPLWALVAVVLLPLLGGDAYRLANIADVRGTATLVLVAGLALLARGWRDGGHRRAALSLAGGALAAAAALVHLQYAVIVVSVLGPLLLLALALPRIAHVSRRTLILTAVAASAVLFVSLVQSASLIRSSSLAEAAGEREEGAGVNGRSLLASGDTVWPPRTVTIDGVDMLYSGPWIHMLHPRELTDPVWGERTHPLISLAGVAAAVLLAPAIGGVLALLLAGTVLAAPLILLNPLVFPLFNRFISAYRSEYIAFEFGYIALAAVGMALVTVVVALIRGPRARRLVVAAPVALAALLVGVLAARPTLDATRDWNDGAREWDRMVAADPGLVAFEDLQRLTRYGDILLAPPPPAYRANILLDRRVRTYDQLGMPVDPFISRQPPAAIQSVRDHLALPRPERVVLLLDGTVPRDAPARILIAEGLLPRLRPASPLTGSFYADVAAPTRQDAPR